VKREKVDIKKIIKKKIEARHQKLIVVDKGNRFQSIVVPVQLSKSKSRVAQRIGVVEKTTAIPVSNVKKEISVIVTAYKTQNFIEECLDSIQNQTYFVDNDMFEILVGVDACQDTLDKLLEIRGKYKNLKIFMMNSNMGTYVTTNTLLSIAKYDNIIRFDSDDIMLPEFINEVMGISDDYDVIRIKCIDFNDNFGSRRITGYQRYAAGVIFYKKKIFDLLGGYEPWSCAADSDLIERMKNIINIGLLNKILFYRRVHGGSLSKNPETNISSRIRTEYRAKISENRRNGIKYIERKINDYIEIQ